jgi:large exoprotein involved in heme utilization and adhesion
MATSNLSFINTPYDITSIDVNLSNITVTSNTIEIPVTVDTKGTALGGLQFQFDYDPTKIKFEELASTLPNSWYVFANAKEGRVKFGALEQNSKTGVTGILTPFKLKFSTIGDGVEILTSVKVSSTMDASSVNGTQLGINLNKTQIKLTGYNNF